jgi:hypothetical protein
MSKERTTQVVEWQGRTAPEMAIAKTEGASAIDPLRRNDTGKT